MLVAGFPAGSFATNCYVAAPAPGRECVVIDPGQDAAGPVEGLLREHRLKPVAILLTHGHIDHVWCVAPLCGAHDVPAYIHPRDRDLLSDPAKGFGLLAGQQLLGGRSFAEPDDVRELPQVGPLPIAGLDVTVDLIPGHTPSHLRCGNGTRTPSHLRCGNGTRTPSHLRCGNGTRAEQLPGSITFSLPAATDTGPLLFSGDLLFAGSIGRTDLPGGSHPQILESLARVCLPLPDETVVLPGHGPASTIGRERASNPLLRQPRDTAGLPAPTRGF